VLLHWAALLLVDFQPPISTYCKVLAQRHRPDLVSAVNGHVWIRHSPPKPAPVPCVVLGVGLVEQSWPLENITGEEERLTPRPLV
jgi:hypothetical protein